MAYKQYIFKTIPRDQYDIEIRLNAESFQPRLYDWTTSLPAKNRDFYQADQSQVAYIDEYVVSQNGIGDIDANVSVDGQLTPGVRSITLLDSLTYSGHDGTGATIAVSAPTGGSLFEEIFNNRAAVHTIFFSRVKTLPVPINYNSGTTYTAGDMVYHHGDWWELGNDAPGGGLTGSEPGGASGYTENTATWVRARELYFVGDIKGNTVVADEFSVHKWVDSITTQIKERVLRTVKFEADDVGIRVSSHVTEHMFEHVSLSDMVVTTPLPAYGGVVNLEGSKWLDGTKTSVSANELWNEQIKHNAQCIPAGVSINDGLHYMPVATVFKKIADTCDFEHSTVNDLSTNMQFWIDKIKTVATAGTAHPWTVATFNDNARTPLGFEITSVNINQSTYYSGASIFDALAVCYEWLVGSNPLCDLHAAEMNSDISFGWLNPLSEMAAQFCDEFIQYVRIDINQATKKPILRCLNRRDTSGAAIPSGLKLGTDAKLLQTNVSAEHVEVSNRGFGDKVACPTRRGKAITKEIPRQAKLRGRKGSFDGNDSIYNASLGPDMQYSCWKTFTGGLKKGGHIICTDATVTEITASSSGHHRYSVTSPSIDARLLTGGGNDEGNGGDIVGWNNVSTQVVEDPINRNTFIVSCYAGETLPTGSGKSFAAGYDIIQNDGVIDTDDATDFHSATRSFIPYIGRNLYIPSRGIFKILSATDVAGVYHCTVDAPLGKAGSGLTFRLGTNGNNIAINPDGYVAGSFFYVYDSSTTADYILNGANDLFNGTEATDYADVGGNGSPLLVHPNALSGQTYPYLTTTYAKGTGDRDWSGMYAVNRCCYGLPDSGTPDTPPDYNFGNTLAGPAQVWAAETIGVYAAKQRVYDLDLTKFSGNLTNLKLLGTISIEANGTNTNYYATGIKFNELQRPGPTVTYQLTEQPASPGGFLSWNQYPVIKLGTGGATGNAGSIGGGGGSGTGGSPSNGGPIETSDAVILKPGTPTRNKIYSQADDTPEIEGVRHSATSTADHAAFYIEDGSTKVFYIDKDGAQHIELQADVVGSVVKASSSQTADLQEWQNNSGTVKASISAAGNLTAQAGSLSGALNMNSHLINNVTDPVANQDAATKKYVDDGLAAIGGFVSLTPNGTTVVNAIIDQTATTVGLSIQKHASQSANVQEWRDASSVPQTYIDQNLEFHTAGSIYVLTNVNGYNVAATNKVTSASTASGDGATTNVTKDWAVTLKPDASNTNIVQAQDSSTVGMTVKKRTGSSQHIWRTQDDSGNDLVKVTSLGVLKMDGYATQLSMSSTGNTTMLLMDASATAASGTNIISLANSGTSGRGQFYVNANGTVQHGPLDQNSVLTKGFGISGQLSVPYKRITSADSPFTMDGSNMKILADCSGGNITVKLPTSTKGSVSLVRKFSASNTLTVQNASGGTVFSWTGNGTGYSFVYDGSTGFEIGNAF